MNNTPYVTLGITPMIHGCVLSHPLRTHEKKYDVMVLHTSMNTYTKTMINATSPFVIGPEALRRKARSSFLVPGIFCSLRSRAWAWDGGPHTRMCDPVWFEATHTGRLPRNGAPDTDPLPRNVSAALPKHTVNPPATRKSPRLASSNSGSRSASSH